MMIGQRAHLGDKQMDTRPTCLTMLRYRVNDHKFRGRCFQIEQNGLSTWLTSVWGAYARYSTAGWGRVSQSYAPAPRLHPGWAMVRPFYSGVWTRLLLGTPLILTKLHSLYIKTYKTRTRMQPCANNNGGHPVSHPALRGKPGRC